MKHENNKNENGRQQFDARIHRLGITSTLVVWCFFLLVPAAICVIFGLKIDLAATAKAAAPIMLIFAITGLCEKLSMAPIIGPGAVYLASSTGNIQNMKLPAALNAMKIMECEEGSEKGRGHTGRGHIILRDHSHRILRHAVPGPHYGSAPYEPGDRPGL